jgi:hypothetical protein
VITGMPITCRDVVVGDRIVVTPRLTEQFALEVTQVVPHTEGEGVHVEGYRLSVHSPHTRSSDTLVWRFLSDLAHIERVAS